MRILILEDDQSRIDEFKKRLVGKDLTITDDANEACKILSENEPFDYIFLDHDLGGQTHVKSEDGTGYQVAKWPAEHQDKAFIVHVHSLNPSGAKNMVSIMKDAGINVYYTPFLWTKVSIS